MAPFSSMFPVVAIAMMMMIAMMMIAGTTATVTFIPEGECVAYVPAAGELGSLCGGVIKQYWRPVGQTGDATIGEVPSAVIADVGNFIQYPLKVRSIIGMADAGVSQGQYDACFEPLRALMCFAYFPPCYPDSSNSSVSLPQQPCRSACASVNSVCANFFATQNPKFGGIKCDDVDAYGHTYPLFPADTTSTNTTEISCNANVPVTASAVQAAYPHGFDHVCLPPMLLPAASDGHCILYCKYLLLPHKANPDFHDAWAATKGLEILSFVSSCLTILTWLAVPRKMVFPTSMILYLAIGSSMVSFALIIKFMETPHDNHGCGPAPNIVATPRNSAACFFQFTALHLGSLIVSFWWLSLAVNMFLIIVMEVRNTVQYEKWFHVLSWGMPLLLWVIPLAADHAEYSQQYQMCWIKADPPASPAYMNGYFFAWIGIIIIVGAFSMSSVIVKVGILMYRQKRFNAAAAQSVAATKQLRKRISSQIRSFVFIVVFIIIYVFVFGSHFIFIAPSTQLLVETSVLIAAICEAEHDPQGLGCWPRLPKLALNFVITEISFLSLQGLAVFFTFGLMDFIRLVRSTFGLHENWDSKSQSNNSHSVESAPSSSNRSKNRSIEMSDTSTGTTAASSASSSSQSTSKNSQSRKSRILTMLAGKMGPSSSEEDGADSSGGKSSKRRVRIIIAVLMLGAFFLSILIVPSAMAGAAHQKIPSGGATANWNDVGVQSIDFLSMSVMPVDASHALLTAEVSAVLISPPSAGPVTVTSASLDVTMTYGAAATPLGTLFVVDAPSRPGAGANTAVLTLKDVVLTLANNGAGMAGLVTSLLVDAAVTIAITGTMNATAIRVISDSQLFVVGLPVSNLGASVAGFNGQGLGVPGVVVENFTFTGDNPDPSTGGVLVVATSQVPNPTVTSVCLGDVDMDAYFENEWMGSVTATALCLSPGLNTLALSGYIHPAPSAQAALTDFVNNYVHKMPSATVIRGRDVASSSPFLGIPWIATIVTDPSFLFDTAIPGTDVPSFVETMAFTFINLTAVDSSTALLSSGVESVVYNPLGANSPINVTAVSLSVDLLYHGASIGHLSVPFVNATNGTNVFITLDNEPLTFANGGVPGMSDFVGDLIALPSVVLTLTGTMDAVVDTALGTFNLNNVVLNNDVAIAGLNGLPNVVVPSLVFVGNNPANPPGGVNITSTALVPNPTIASMCLGDVQFHVLHQGHVIGTVNAMGMCLARGMNEYSMGGFVVAADADAPALQDFTSLYVTGQTSEATIKGVAVLPTSTAPPYGIPWIAAVVANSLSLDAAVVGLNETSYVTSLVFTSLALTPVDNGTALVSFAANTAIVNPLGSGSPINVTAVASMTVTMWYNGVEIGTLSATDVTVGNGTDATVVTLSVTGATMVLPGSGAGFAAFVGNLVRQPSVTLSLTGTFDVVAQTSLCGTPLLLSGLPLQIAATTLTGLNGIPGVTVPYFGFTGNAAVGVGVVATSYIPNPTVTSMCLGHVTFRVLLNGAVIGWVTSSAPLCVGPEQQNLVNMTGYAWTTTAAGDVAAMQAFVTNYVADVGTEVMLAGMVSDMGIGWVNTVVQTALIVNTTIPGTSYASYASAMAMTALTIGATGSSTQVSMAATTQATIVNPLGPASPINVTSCGSATLNLFGINAGAYTPLASVSVTSGIVVTNGVNAVTIGLALPTNTATLQGTGLNFGNFVAQMVNEASVMLRVQGSITMTVQTPLVAAPLVLPNLPVDVNVTLQGLNGIPNITVSSFTLPSNDNSGSGGVVLNVNANVPNPSVATICMGHAGFDAYFQATKIGHVNVTNLCLAGSQSTNAVNLVGYLLPSPTVPIAVLQNLFQNYVSDVASATTIVGVAQGTSAYAWVTTAVQAMTLATMLPGSNASIITGLSVPRTSAIDMVFAQANAPLLGGSFTATVAFPFPFPMTITGMAVANGVLSSYPALTPFATVAIPMQTSTSNQTASQAYLVLPSPSSIPMTITAAATFSTFLSSALNAPNVSLAMSGTASAVISSRLGVLTVTGLSFVNLPMTLAAMNGLRGISASITDILSSTTSTVTQKVASTITNPSQITVTLGYLGMTIKTTGGVYIGNASASAVRLAAANGQTNVVNMLSFFVMPGTPTVVAASTGGTYQSQATTGLDTSAAAVAGRSFLSSFLTNMAQSIILTPAATATDCPYLVQAFQNMLPVTATLQGIGWQLIEDSVIVGDACFGGINAGVSSKVQNLFSAAVTTWKLDVEVNDGGSCPVGLGNYYGYVDAYTPIVSVPGNSVACTTFLSVTSVPVVTSFSKYVSLNGFLGLTIGTAFSTYVPFFQNCVAVSSSSSVNVCGVPNSIPTGVPSSCS